MLPGNRQRVLRAICALQLMVSKEQTTASQLALTVLYLWQRRSFPALIHRAPRPDEHIASDPRVTAFADWLARCDFLDAAFWLSSAYAAWVGDEMRAQRAMFFTPPKLSKRLISNLVKNNASLTQHVWMDPACGGAAFLAPVAKRMAKELRRDGVKPKRILKHVASHVIGSDADPTLARMSWQFLRMALYDEITESNFEPGFNITIVDALTRLKHHLNRVDVVICNPPYRKMTAAEVSCYRKSYHDVIAGQPNLYGLFFKLSLRLLRQGGVGGLLTPTSFLSGRYFSPIRTYVLQHADTVQLDVISERVGVFASAELETAITILRKRRPSKIVPRKTRVFAFDKNLGFANVGQCVLPNSGLAWPVPRDKGDAETIRAVNGTPFRLRDYGYEARIGAFVWNRDRRKTFRKIQSASQNRSVFPLIWSSDIRQSGSFQFGRLHREHDRDMYVDMESRDHNSVIRRPCIALQRVTSPDQPRRLVGAPVSKRLMQRFGGVVGENHVVFLEQTQPEVKLSPSRLAMVLRSDAIDRLFRCISGAVNVSVFELGQLPLPDPDVLAGLLRRGMSVDKAVKIAFKAKTPAITFKENGQV